MVLEPIFRRNFDNPEEQAESQKPVMSMRVEESHGISPATCDLLKKMVAVHRRMSKDEEYRKEIAKNLS